MVRARSNLHIQVFELVSENSNWLRVMSYLNQVGLLKNRENEGDFLAAAELITPEIINFMATHGRGLICAPITENTSKRLGLNLMVGTNTDPQDTAFTVSIDLKGNGVTTGISVSDRAATIKALIDKKAKPNQFDQRKPREVCYHVHQGS